LSRGFNWGVEHGSVCPGWLAQGGAFVPGFTRNRTIRGRVIAIQLIKNGHCPPPRLFKKLGSVFGPFQRHRRPQSIDFCRRILAAAAVGLYRLDCSSSSSAVQAKLGWALSDSTQNRCTGSLVITKRVVGDKAIGV